MSFYDSTPWGYIHQKKKTEEALDELNKIRRENEMLAGIVKKLTKNEKLNDSEEKFLKDKKLL